MCTGWIVDAFDEGVEGELLMHLMRGELFWYISQNTCLSVISGLSCFQFWIAMKSGEDFSIFISLEQTFFKNWEEKSERWYDCFWNILPHLQFAMYFFLANCVFATWSLKWFWYSSQFNCLIDFSGFGRSFFFWLARLIKSNVQVLAGWICRMKHCNLCLVMFAVTAWTLV